MRTLKYALLGMLDQRSLSGYDIAKEFEETLSEFWYAKHSQIYPELNKLAEEGLISFEMKTVGTSLQKKIYSITELGRKDFLEWLKQDTPLGHTPKSEFRLRVFFSNALDGAVRYELFIKQRKTHEARLEHLRNGLNKFDTLPPQDGNAFGDYMVLLGAIMREEFIINWLSKCIEMCRSHDKLV